MTRTLPSLRLLVATIVVGGSALICLGASAVVPGSATAGAAGGTALPAGWELCVLQGLGAPATQANVSDLDEWQLVEGGSTNNTAAYNPFNTRRTTDVNNNPLQLTMSSNGFPAFANWPNGCAATVATLFQPNMWSITAALRSGNVSPPGAFLAAVDQSQWCAPDANGTPCYENAILGVAGSIATAVLTSSSALDVYGNVKNDVHAYQLSVLAVSNDQNDLTAKNHDLAAALLDEQGAQATLAEATGALRRFAIDEYVTSGLYVSSAFGTGQQAPVGPTGPLNADGVVAHQYESIAASDLVTRDQAATMAYRAARDHVHETSAAVAAALAKVNADGTAQTRSLAKLVADVATMQTAGACTSIVLTSAPLGLPAAGQGGAAGSAPSTDTTTTTTLPTALAAGTTTTTSTTLPANAAPALSPPPAASDTTTTTTSSTTTTTVPPSPTTTTTTTTTTTVPAPPASGTGGSTPTTTTTPAPPASADPVGFTALQGCMAGLAPPAA